MKLPPVVLAQAPKLKTAGYGVVQQDAQARQGLIDSTITVATAYSDAHASSQYVTSKNQSKRDLDDLHQRMNSTLTNIKDLRGVAYNQADIEEGADGEKYIPTHTVSNDIWKQGVSEIKAKASDTNRHPKAAGEFNAYWDDVLEKSRVLAGEQFEKGNRDYLVAAAGKEIDKAVAAGDYEGAVDQLFMLKKEGFLDQNGYQEASGKIQETINTQLKAQELEAFESNLLVDAETTKDVESLYGQAAYLRSDEYQGQLGSKERDRLADASEKKADDNKLSLYSQQERAKAKLVSDVDIAINNNDPRVTVGAIDQLYEDGVIDAPKRTSMTKALTAGRKQNNEDLAFDALISKIGTDGGNIDPGNPKQVSAVNRAYLREVEKGGDPLMTGIQFMETYHVVPEPIQGVMRGANRSDVQSLTQAGILWNEMERSAPRAMDSFKGSGTNLVQNVAANMQLGMSPADSVASAIESADMTPEQRETISIAYKATATADPGALQDLVNAGYGQAWYSFSDVAPITLTQQVEFDSLTEKYIPLSGNVQAAQQRAFSDFRRKYQVTTINGDDQLMANPPVGNDVLMRKDLEGKHGKGAFIQSDALTQIQRDGGETLTYHVMAGGDVPELETKSRKNSKDYETEWRESFDKSSDFTLEQLGLETKEEAESYLSVLYADGNVVDLGRWEYDEQAAQEKENKKTVKEASESFAKREGIRLKREQSRAEWQTRQYAAEIGLKPSEYLLTPEGKEMTARNLSNIRVSGGVF